MVVIAHRGAMGLAPENTLRAFRRAVAMGAKWIECDVRMTRDGVPVIIHDATVNRTTDGRGRVSGITYQALRKLDAGKREKIPSLKETLLFAKQHKINLVLEIKDPRALQPTIRLVQAYGYTHPVRAKHASPLQFIISSFSSAVILHAKKLLPSLTTALIIERSNADWVRVALRARANMVHVLVPLVSKKKTSAAHAAGLKVWAWTANTLKEALKLRKRGSDGIFTDVPHRLISLT